MRGDESEDIQQVVIQLGQRIRKHIKNALSDGKISPAQVVFVKWKVDEFEYGEIGVSKTSAHKEYETKVTWSEACHIVEQEIKKTEEYALLLQLVESVWDGLVGSEIVVKMLVLNLISKRLDNGELTDEMLERVTSTFMKEIVNDQIKYRAEVYLSGIVVLSQELSFCVGGTDVCLRQTLSQDLEREQPLDSFGIDYNFIQPSAILTVKLLTRDLNSIHSKINQAIAILRLFRIGSIKYNSYQMYSESVTKVFTPGRVSSIRTISVLERCLIKDEDGPKLRRFWQEMATVIPDSFYEIGQETVDHLSIAYKRYCDAILENGVLERRIANAVMGLEALFLKGSERQELSYRLKMRIATVLSHFGFDQYIVRENVKYAYELRSMFVHGGHLSYNEKRKLINRFGDEKALLLLLLDYLRNSIVIMLQCRKEKEKMLDLIDDSFIDESKRNQLVNWLSSSLYLLGKD